MLIGALKNLYQDIYDRQIQAIYYHQNLGA